MHLRPLSALLLAAMGCCAAITVQPPSALADATWYTQDNPIQVSQLTDIPFGERSYWLQPWRSQLVTRSAQTLEDAIGLDINNQVEPAEMPSLLQLMHDSGFTVARYEIGWDSMSYSDPTEPTADPASWEPAIAAMRANDVRPLILLNGDPGGPTPNVASTLNVTEAAAAGATTVQLDSASAASVVPGLTGFNLDGVMAADLITNVSGSGVATLSRPLPSAMPAGSEPAATLRYAPFQKPYLADGSTPNPAFEQTLAGWLAYVRAVCDSVASIYGSDNFDVEVWNENQTFTDADNYSSPAPDANDTGNTTDAILQATVDMLGDPSNGLTDVQVGDGFSSQTPFVSGSSVPAGTAAIDKHPYQSVTDFPSQQPEPSFAAVDALGDSASVQIGQDDYQDIFAPTFTAFMPEYDLTGYQTETLMRDLSVTGSDIYGTMHGADQHPAGGAAPSMWVTEDNLDQCEAATTGMPASDVAEMEAKAALRYFTSYVSEGATLFDLYAAKDACDGEIDPAYFSAIDSDPASNPENLAGPVLPTVGRMISTLSGAQSITDPRQLTLNAVASDNNTDVQFEGNGTANFPDVYNRNVLAFFPFQVSQNKFVASVYVMTNNLTEKYSDTPTGGQTSYDLPPENFRITIGNVDGLTAQVSLYDPLLNQSEDASIVSRTADSLVVQLQATDSPRMLTIDDSGLVTTKGSPTAANDPMTTGNAPETDSSSPSGATPAPASNANTTTSSDSAGTDATTTTDSAATAVKRPRAAVIALGGKTRSTRRTVTLVLAAPTASAAKKAAPTGGLAPRRVFITVPRRVRRSTAVEHGVEVNLRCLHRSSVRLVISAWHDRTKIFASRIMRLSGGKRSRIVWLGLNRFGREYSRRAGDGGLVLTVGSFEQL